MENTNQKPLEILVVEDTFTEEGLLPLDEDEQKKFVLKNLQKGKGIGDIPVTKPLEIKQVEDDLNVRVTMVPTYNHSGSESFNSVISKDYDFYIVDGTFPIFLNKESETIVGDIKGLLENAQNKDAESVIKKSMNENSVQNYYEEFRKGGCLEDDIPNPIKMFGNLKIDNLKELWETRNLEKEEQKKFMGLYNQGEHFLTLKDINRLAGVSILKKLKENGKRYVLFTNDPSHGRFGIYVGVANDLIDSDILARNYAKTRKYNYNSKLMIEEQDVSEGGVIFGEGQNFPKSDSYPYLIRKIVEKLRE